MVQESASSQPPPSANPLIAQIEGFPIVSLFFSALRSSASPRYLFFSVLGALLAPRPKGRLCLIFFSVLTTKNELLSEFHRPRILRIRIIIKPPSRLPPVPPRQHHPLQQWLT